MVSKSHARCHQHTSMSCGFFLVLSPSSRSSCFQWRTKEKQRKTQRKKGPPGRRGRRRALGSQCRRAVRTPQKTNSFPNTTTLQVRDAFLFRVSWFRICQGSAPRSPCPFTTVRFRQVRLRGDEVLDVAHPHHHVDAGRRLGEVLVPLREGVGLRVVPPILRDV